MNFWRMAYTRRLSPGGEGEPAGGAPAGEPNKPAEPTGGTVPGDSKEKPPADPEKYVPLDKHKKVSDKLKETEDELAKYRKEEDDRKKADMTEAQRLQAERDALAKENSELTKDKAKGDALQKARLAIGTGFHIDPEDEARLTRTVAKLSYDPKTVEQDIADIVEGMKKVKGTPHSKIGNPPRDQQAPIDMKGFTAPSIHDAYN